MSKPFIGLWNKHGQCIVVASAEAHLPQIRVSWQSYGIGSGGHTAQLPGETVEQAALRAFGSHVPTCYADTFTYRVEELLPVEQAQAKGWLR